jgi:hypothetical protein
MMRLTRILVFPFFPLSIMDQLPLHRGAFHNAQRTSLETGVEYTRLTGQSTQFKFESQNFRREDHPICRGQRIQRSVAVGLEF